MFCCLGWQVDSSSRHAGDHHGRSPRHPIFKGRPFDEEIIILCLRWYVTYKLSFRDLAEMMLLRRRRARLAARSRAALSVASPHEVTDDLLHPAPMRALPVDRVAACRKSRSGNTRARSLAVADCGLLLSRPARAPGYSAGTG